MHPLETAPSLLYRSSGIISSRKEGSLELDTKGSATILGASLACVGLLDSESGITLLVLERVRELIGCASSSENTKDGSLLYFN